MLLSIIMPTIHFRQPQLVQSVSMYERLTPFPIEWIVETGHATCGEAWNAGVAKATGDIVHMGADDIEPESDAWFPAAMEVINRGGVPLGWVREDVIGTFGRDFCRVIICPREWWRDVPPVHYYSDNAWTDLMVDAGHAPLIAPGFDFYHRRSMVGRDESSERLQRDRLAYEKAKLVEQDRIAYLKAQR